MHNLTRKRACMYRKRWLDSAERCNILFSRYNELCDAIFDYENKGDWDSDDLARYKDLIDDRLICDCELVNARAEFRVAWREYYFEFPFLALFDKCEIESGDFD